MKQQAAIHTNRCKDFPNNHEQTNAGIKLQSNFIASQGTKNQNQLRFWFEQSFCFTVQCLFSFT